MSELDNSQNHDNAICPILLDDNSMLYDLGDCRTYQDMKRLNAFGAPSTWTGEPTFRVRNIARTRDRKLLSSLFNFSIIPF